MKFLPSIYALFCQIMSQQTFTHFLTVCQKYPQHDHVKPKGGGQGPFTQCVKKHQIWLPMASLIVADRFPVK